MQAEPQVTPVSDPRQCAQCGSALGAAGLCEPCLLRTALEPVPPPVDPMPGARFGDYVLGERLGRGGMGIVYRAQRANPERTVALKMIRGGDLADDVERKRFLAEAQHLAVLHHPNIVPLYEFGEHDGCPWFTMRLMEGGTLADAMPRLQANRREACELLAVVARAVHHGHQRAILHRDLKPANVLLDRDGVPSVADFGTAKLLTDGRGLTQSGAVVGTLGYMAPEQAAGNPAEVTLCADVYSLGAMLYEALTGRPPHTAATQTALLRLLDSPPESPRTLVPGLERKLENICLKCLERDPGRRYASAAELADDLEAFLEGRPVKALAAGRVERTVAWARRHPIATAVAVALLAFSATAAWAARIQEARSRADILAANTFAARMAAGTVLARLVDLRDQFRFRERGDVVQWPSRDAELIAALEQKNWDALRDAPLPVGVSMPRHQSAFDSWLLLDADGVVRTRWPEGPAGDLGRDLGWREYFEVSRQTAYVGRRTVHVSAVFADEVDGRAKFAFSTPLFGAHGTFAGVLVAMVTPEAAFGGLSLGDGADSARRTVALAAPRHRAPGEAGDDRPYLMLVHDQVKRGPVAFDARRVAGLAALEDPHPSPTDDPLRPPSPDRVSSADDYADPMGGAERWLAGFAPVGSTGEVVIVQTRYDIVLESMLEVLQPLALPVALGALAALAIWRLRRRLPTS